jgi:hypothetical protein
MEDKDIAAYISAGAACLAALSATIFGIKNYLSNKKQNIKLEEIKAKYQRDNIVHKIQFEKEFSLYTELWGYSLKLTEKMADIGNLLETKSYSELVPKFVELIQFEISLSNFIRANLPFFDKTIYNEVFKLAGVLNELVELGTKHRKIDENNIEQFNYQDFLVDQKTFSQKVNNYLENIKELIRNRITVQ